MGECVVRKLYYPTTEERESAHEAITKLCEFMAKMPIYELYTMKSEMEELAKQFPSSKEFLELEPEEMVRRHKMGIEAAKVLIIR